MLCEHHKDALIEAAAPGCELMNTPVADVRMTALHAHLESCPSCRAAFAQEQSLFAAIDSGLRGVTNTEVPASLLPRVRASLGDAVAPQRRWMQPLVLASAGVALASLLLLVVRPNRPRPENLAKQTPPVTASETLRGGTHEGISPSSVQVASIGSKHAHASASSTVIRSVAPSNPEVLVPPDEREGLAKLVATLNEEGDVAAAFLAQRPEKKDTLVAVDFLQISDIEIKPLEGAETEAADGAGEKQ